MGSEMCIRDRCMYVCMYVCMPVNCLAFNDFLAQTRLNLDTDEEVIFLYHGAPVYRNPAIRAANAQLWMLQAYSPFLKIVEQAIGSLKAAIKRDVSRPEIQARMDDRAEIRRLGFQLEETRTRSLPDALRRCIGVITATTANKWLRFMQTYLPRCLNGEEIEG